MEAVRLIPMISWYAFGFPVGKYWMKIFELVGVKRYSDMTAYEFEEVMRKSGFEHIAGGTHAQVFRRSADPFVYRVALDDSPYEAYAEFVVKSPPNPHYPRIYKISNLSNFFKRPIGQRWSRYNIVKVEYIPDLLTEQEFREFDRVYRSSWYRDGVLWSDADPAGKWRSLVSAFNAIFEAVQVGSMDMHRANFGKRSDGSVVILDPLWEGETPYQAYDRARRAEVFDYDDDPEYVSGAWNQRREKERFTPVLAKPSYPQYIGDDLPF